MSTVDSTLTSFIDIASDSDFSIHNLPYGIFSDTADGKRRAGVAIGEQVLDLAVIEAAGLLSLDGGPYFDKPTLNAFIDSGRNNWTQARKTIQMLLSSDNDALRDSQDLQKGRCSSKQTSPCTCQYKYQVSPIFTLQKNTPPTSARCSVTQVMRYCLTGLRCRLAIMDAPAP